MEMRERWRIGKLKVIFKYDFLIAMFGDDMIFALVGCFHGNERYKWAVIYLVPMKQHHCGIERTLSNWCKFYWILGFFFQVNFGACFSISLHHRVILKNYLKYKKGDYRSYIFR